MEVVIIIFGGLNSKKKPPVFSTEGFLIWDVFLIKSQANPKSPPAVLAVFKTGKNTHTPHEENLADTIAKLGVMTHLWLHEVTGIDILQP